MPVRSYEIHEESWEFARSRRSRMVRYRRIISFGPGIVGLVLLLVYGVMSPDDLYQITGRFGSGPSIVPMIGLALLGLSMVGWTSPGSLDTS